MRNPEQKGPEGGPGRVCPECGGSKEIIADGIMEVDCPTCNGMGVIENPESCPACNGRGKRVVHLKGGEDEAGIFQTCPDCEGSGKRA